MAAYSTDKKTLAYKLGESLSKMTDHYLLMTATPHKGDPENFCLFLELLDRDIYGNVKSLEEAMRRNHAPFYLRRTKEALVTFPDTETGEVKKLFTNRDVRTASFDLDGDEYDFYHALTTYVEDQSIKASEDDSARGRALTFTMAMLQRRFASSVYAVRRSLERMKAKREKILADPPHRNSELRFGPDPEVPGAPRRGAAGSHERFRRGECLIWGRLERSRTQLSPWSGVEADAASYGVGQAPQSKSGSTKSFGSTAKHHQASATGA